MQARSAGRWHREQMARFVSSEEHPWYLEDCLLRFLDSWCVTLSSQDVAAIGVTFVKALT